MFFGGIILLRLDPQAFSINFEIHVSPNLCKENAVEENADCLNLNEKMWLKNLC